MSLQISIISFSLYFLFEMLRKQPDSASLVPILVMKKNLLPPEWDAYVLDWKIIAFYLFIFYINKNKNELIAVSWEVVFSPFFFKSKFCNYTLQPPLHEWTLYINYQLAISFFLGVRKVFLSTTIWSNNIHWRNGGWGGYPLGLCYRPVWTS